MKKAVLIVIVLFPLSIFAQTPLRDLPDAVKQIIETLASRADEEQVLDLQSLYDMYESLLEDPVDLNTATEDDLRQLQLLTDFQIQSLLEYRNVSGSLFSIYEIPLIHGFNEEFLEQLRPFITVRPLSEWKSEAFSNQFLKGRHQLIGRTGRVLETQKGYTLISPEDLIENPNSRYLGSPWNAYFRYRYTYRTKMRWGLTAANQSGEPLFAGINKAGFDFYSAHIQMKDWGILKNMVAGDYHVQFGQGLVAWSGMTFGKTGDVLTIKKQERGFTGYSSTDENRFYRGVAATLNFKQLAVSAFVSRKKVDATKDSAGFHSLQLSGQHNTHSSAAGKNTVNETIFGGNLSYRWNHIKIGVTGLVSNFGDEFNRDIKPYNRFELSTHSNANLGFDFSTTWKRVSAFGEWAVSQNGGKAGLLGFLFDLDHSLCLSAIYRNYARDYQAYYASGFGEGSKTSNEEGWYLGLQWMPHHQWTVAAYVDLFTFPWLRYQVDAPSSGWEYWMQADYNLSKEVMMYLRISQEYKMKNAQRDRVPVTQLQPVNTTHLRYQIRYTLLPGLTMTDLVEGSFFQEVDYETGVLLYHDIKYKLPQFPIDFSLRFSAFNTDTWNTRIYAYESDALYAMSIPAHAGKGARWYINLHAIVKQRVDIWLRLAQSRYFNQTTNGSGLHTIDGNTHTDIKLQVSIKI